MAVQAFPFIANLDERMQSEFPRKPTEELVRCLLYQEEIAADHLAPWYLREVAQAAAVYITEVIDRRADFCRAAETAAGRA